MQAHKKLAKNSPSLSGSRRQLKSYLQRYKQKASNGEKSSSTLYSKQQTSLTAQISQIQQSFQQISFYSDMKIEQEIDEYENMTSEYLQEERKWTAQIGQIKNLIGEIKEAVKLQQKNIKEIQKEISSKRARLITLEQKLLKSKETLQGTVQENYDELIESYQTQYDQINEIGQRSIRQAQAELAFLQEQNNKMNKQVWELQEELRKRPLTESHQFNIKIAGLIQEEQHIKMQVSQMEQQSSQIQKYLKQLQESRPIRDQVHRRYLQLYQKMFINEQLDIMGELITFKNKQIERMQDYTKRKTKYREKRSEIEQIQYRIISKKQIISKLEEDIRDCSTKLLNLYQMEL